MPSLIPLERFAYRKDRVYLADNCSEIVLDRLLPHQIKKQFPALDICIIVREKLIVNDTTMEDADTVRLSEEFHVIGLSRCLLSKN